MKKYIPHLLLALVSLIISACKESESNPNINTTVKTIPVQEISFTESTLKSELTISTEEIFDCGFVWSKSPHPTTGNADKKYFGPQQTSQILSYHVSGLSMNTVYYYRPFIISSEGILYGTELSFTTAAMNWTGPEGFPGLARTGAISFTINNKVYFGLGHGRLDENVDQISFFQDFWEFDVVSNTWAKKKDFPGGARSGAVAFSMNNQGYAGTGATKEGSVQDFWEYNPASDEWTQKADFAGGNIGWAVGFSINGKGYVGTGRRGVVMINDFFEYNSAENSWTRKADFPGLAVDQAIGFSIEDKGYIGMGLRAESWLGNTHQFWEFDPGKNAWTQKKDCPSTSDMYGSIGFVLNKKAYVGLGYSIDKSIWEYNPDYDSWQRSKDFTGSDRWGAIVFSAGEKAIIGSGASSSQFYKDFIEYRPNYNKRHI